MAKSRSLLNRLLSTPDLANAVPRLQPDVLHRVIQTCGLEDCALTVVATVVSVPVAGRMVFAQPRT